MTSAKESVGDKRKQGDDVDSAVACTAAVPEKPRKTSMRAWLVDVSCNSKEDISCFDLQMRDPFAQLKTSYFKRDVMIQQVLVRNKQKIGKKKSVALCFDEAGLYTQKHNLVMEEICREIWPNKESNPFAHGAFGPYILYYAGRVSGAPCEDMESVDTIDALIKRLAASN